MHVPRKGRPAEVSEVRGRRDTLWGMTDEMARAMHQWTLIDRRQGTSRRSTVLPVRPRPGEDELCRPHPNRFNRSPRRAIPHIELLKLEGRAATLASDAERVVSRLPLLFQRASR